MNTFIVLVSCVISLTMNDVDTNITYLEKYIDMWPPQVENEKELVKIRKVYHQTEESLLAMVKVDGKDIDVLCKLGNLYRMGHNMDEKGSWENAQRYLTTASKIDSTAYEAQYLLGCLYVGSDLSLAQKAESLFTVVYDKSTDSLKLQALWGLCISSWMQGKKQRTLDLTKEYLFSRPKDEAALSLNRMAEKGVELEK